ncbi:hypothetical protein HanIR_Chr10g0500721 [Helianthus annuus]|nr:hypothetical protein HanIR_Chr10g0500721 [Helianthus annuus]
MGDTSRRINIEKIVDLVELKKKKKDIKFLNHCDEQSHGLRSRCPSFHARVETLCSISYAGMN